jgi:transcriptional regulator with XRE-family HTH domain
VASFAECGERLRILRAERGLTQDQMAEAAAVSRVTYNSWEMGRTRPQPEHWKRLARALGLRTPALMHALGLGDEDDAELVGEIEAWLQATATRRWAKLLRYSPAGPDATSGGHAAPMAATRTPPGADSSALWGLRGLLASAAPA